MASKRRQIRNPYIRFGKTAQGAFANNLGNGFHARSISKAFEKCFYIVSAEIGRPFPTLVSVCFNAPPDAATCHGIPPFNFKTVARGAFTDQGVSFYPFGANCLAFSVDYLGESVNSAGPQDTVQLDYVPGTCSKDGDSECLLDAYSDFPVTNSIWGPIVLRIGDIAADILVAGFPSNVGDPGSASDWLIKVNGGVQAGVSLVAVGDTIQFTLPAPVSNTDVVTISHVDPTDGAQSSDGRYCWVFYDAAVINSVGGNFWIREDAGQWRTEVPGRWQLET